MTKPGNSKVQYFLAKCKGQLAIDRVGDATLFCGRR